MELAGFILQSLHMPIFIILSRFLNKLLPRFLYYSRFETKLSPLFGFATRAKRTDEVNHPKYKTNFPLSQLPKSVVAASDWLHFPL
ncbi:hypothetical protein B0A67_15690 [Flavobacterium aquidurense]|nr:hypothetical protein B0A67_15690 [Flavobacterium aquidurense]